MAICVEIVAKVDCRESLRSYLGLVLLIEDFAVASKGSHF